MKVLFLIVCFVLTLYSMSIAHASTVSAEQFLGGYANYVRIDAPKVQDGDIVSFSPQGYILTKTPYDPNMAGVVMMHSAVSLVTEDERKAYPVGRSGNAYVRVSGENGSIEKGDLITSSTKSGVGMKATKSGYILGAALESHTFSKPTDIAMISLTLNTHYFIGKAVMQSSFSDIFNLSIIATYNEPLTVIKYVIVTVIVMFTFGSGFFIFQRIVIRGIDSIGRNPLAAHIIELGMLVGVVVTVAVVAGGLFIAYLVLRL